MAKGFIPVEIPKSCYECDYCGDGKRKKHICMATPERKSASICTSRPEWCPIRPMPVKPDYPPISDTSYIAGWNAGVDKLEEKDATKK